MAGVIPADVTMHDRPQGRGYVQLRETGASPWPAVGGEPPVISAHEFHYSRLENVAPGLSYAYEVVRGAGIDGRHDGIVLGNVLASYTHLRDTGGNHWAARFVAHVNACRRDAAGAYRIDSP
jgi:cobyrinic acid a,c-diamide synthase